MQDSFISWIEASQWKTHWLIMYQFELFINVFKGATMGSFHESHYISTQHNALCTRMTWFPRPGKVIMTWVLLASYSWCVLYRIHLIHEKQRSLQRKCKEHLSNQPSHRGNTTHQGVSISQPCHEEKCMEWWGVYSLDKKVYSNLDV